MNIKMYAMYNLETGRVNRLVTCDEVMFSQLSWMPGEDRAMEVDKFTPPGSYNVVNGELVRWFPEIPSE